MTLVIVPRAVIGVADPGNRARLADGLGYLVGHYPGVAGYHDPAKDYEYAEMVARYGAAAGKTWEYNYLIGLGGTVFEQAGDRLAAHCLNFNPSSYGVLLMAGIGVSPTRAMIDAFRDLRHELAASGKLRMDHVVGPHYMFRSTACCGTQLAVAPGKAWTSPTGQGRVGALIDPLLEPWTPTPILEDFDMIALDLNPGSPGWVRVTWNGIDLAWVQGEADHVQGRAGVKAVTVSRAELASVIQSSRTRTKSPFLVAVPDPELDVLWAQQAA